MAFRCPAFYAIGKFYEYLTAKSNLNFNIRSRRKSSKILFFKAFLISNYLFFFLQSFKLFIKFRLIAL